MEQAKVDYCEIACGDPTTPIRANPALGIVKLRASKPIRPQDMVGRCILQPHDIGAPFANLIVPLVHRDRIADYRISLVSAHPDLSAPKRWQLGAGNTLTLTTYSSTLG